MKRTYNKTFISVLVIAILLFVSVMMINTNDISAEENLTVKKSGIYSSALYNVFADKHSTRIATARLSTLIELHSDGEGIFIVFADIVPNVNDGSNDYIFKQMVVNYKLGSSDNDLRGITVSDNATDLVVTKSTGVSTTVGVSKDNVSVSFGVSSNISITAPLAAITAQGGGTESLPALKNINREIIVKSVNEVRDQDYHYVAAVFFKFDPNRDSVKSFDARLGTLQIDGAWFAPDY